MVKKTSLLLLICGLWLTNISLKADTKPIGQVESSFEYWAQKANYFSYSGLTDSHKISTEHLVEIASARDDDALMGRAYAFLGSYFITVGDYSRALEYLYTGLEISENQGNALGISLSSKEMGVVFNHIKNYKEALKHLRRAAQFIDELDSVHITYANRMYCHMAESHLGMDQVDSALKYVQLANSVTLKENDPYGYARTLQIFGMVYARSGEKDLSETYFKKCIGYCEERDLSFPLIKAAVQYGQLLRSMGKEQASWDLAHKAYKYASAREDLMGKSQGAELLSLLHAGKAQKDSAYFYALVKHESLDRIFNEQLIHQISHLNIDRQITELERQRAQEAELKNEARTLQYMAIATGIVFLVILFLLLSNSIVVHEKFIRLTGVGVLLITFEFIHMLVHPYFGRITDHSPLVMLMALVSVAIILVPGHHYLESWSIKRLIEKNKEIRLRAAQKTIQELSTKS